MTNTDTIGRGSQTLPHTPDLIRNVAYASVSMKITYQIIISAQQQMESSPHCGFTDLIVFVNPDYSSKPREKLKK